MATANQISYGRAQEERRHNRVAEAETNRANLAREGETLRSNVANETISYAKLAETKRSNLATEGETNRANLAKEAETARANKAREQETNRANMADEDIKTVTARADNPMVNLYTPTYLDSKSVWNRQAINQSKLDQTATLHLAYETLPSVRFNIK